MKLKLYILAMLFISTLPLAKAQESKLTTTPDFITALSSRIDNYPHSIKGLSDLKLGDILPKFKIEKIINAKERMAYSTNFNDKLLIIDFWGTGCPSCIASFPHMEALQKQFGDKIKILPVDYEAENFIKPIWAKNPILSKTTLPSVVGDRTFRSYFTHRGTGTYLD